MFSFLNYFMKNLYSFFYLKKIIRLKHSPYLSFFISTKGDACLSSAESATQHNFDRKKSKLEKNKKNVLFSIFMDNIQKTILQKVNLNFQKNINKNKKINILKKSFSNQCKKNIQSTYYFQKIFNLKFTRWFHSAFMKISTKFFFLNKLNLNRIRKNIPIKIEKILNISNIFKNFHQILLSIFTKWQKNFISFIAEQVFSPIGKKFFSSNNINNKQQLKNYFYLLQKKYFKKKFKFAIFLFQIFFKNIQQSFKNSLPKFFLNANFLKKNLNFLFIQLFLELQFSLFLILKNFQSFLIEQNVLQIFLQKQYLKKKKKIFSFFFKDIFLPQVNSKKIKILDFLFVFGLQNFFAVSNKNYFMEKNKNFNLNIYQKVLKFFLLLQKKQFAQIFDDKQLARTFCAFQLKTGCQPAYKKYVEHSGVFIKLAQTCTTSKCRRKSCLSAFQANSFLLKSKKFASRASLPGLGYAAKQIDCQFLQTQNRTNSILLIKGKLKRARKMKFFKQPLNNNIKVFIKKIFFLYNSKKFISSKKQTNKLFYFRVWKFLWKNFHKLMEKKNLKLFYKLNIQNKQKTKLCFLFSHNILKLGKIFSIFFYFTKIDFGKTYEKKDFFCNYKKNCWHRTTFLTNSSTSSAEKTFSSTCQSSSETNQINFPFSLNQMFFLKKNNVLNKTQKKILCKFLKFIKKNIQIFFEYFCVLNCLKTHINFFSNENDFQILSHQQLKFSFFHFQQKNKNNIKFCMQSLIYCDYFTSFSFLQSFPIINIQKSKNDYFFNIFSQFVNLYSMKKIENLYKIDQIHLLNNLNKIFCETNIQKFLTLFQKKLANLHKKAFYSQGNQTNMLFINQIITFDISIILFKFFYCYFEKILFHLYKTFKLQQIKNYLSKKSNFVSFINFSYLKNFCIKNKCSKNFFLEPINFIYKHYYENSLFFDSMICLFINNQKFPKLMNFYFYKCEIFKKWFLNNFKNIQMCPTNFVFRNIPLINLFKIFSLNISKKQKGTIHLLHFDKKFWLLSKKILFKSTKLSKKYFFSFSAFFSSFFVQKSQNNILFLQKKVRKNVFFMKNYFHLNFEGFSVLNFIWKKNSKILFVFQKNKTSQNIQIHLKQCQQIIKNSIGKKQLFFMKKLQRKIKIWCQEYKNNIYNCQLNSAFAQPGLRTAKLMHGGDHKANATKVSAIKTFHYCDSMLLKYLWNWAQKTHPNKNKLWIKKKYFHFIHSKKWFFGKKVGKVFICLPLHSQTKI